MKDKKTPQISIIVPVYKVEQYLRRCFDSLINQTKKELQIIVVTDGPEECNIICEEYAQKDSRIELIYDVKKGLGGARNAGIEVAKAPYIMFVDSDDWVKPDMCEKLFNAMQQKNIDMAISGIEVIFDKVQKTYTGIWEIKHQGQMPVNREMLSNLNLEVWNKIYKKSIIDKYKIRFYENFHAEDISFVWAYLSFASNAYFIKDKLYHYLRREDSLTEQSKMKSTGKKAIDPVKAGELFYNHLSQYGLYESHYYIFWDMYSQCSHLAILYASNKIIFEVKNEINKFLNSKNIKIPQEHKFDFLRDIKISPNCQMSSIKIISLFKNLPLMTIKKYPQKEQWWLFDKMPIFEKERDFKNEFANKKILFYGAGLFAQNILNTYDFSSLNILGLMDVNKDKENTYLGKYKIFHTDKINQLKPDIIVLCVANVHVVYPEVVKMLQKNGITTEVFPYLFSNSQIEDEQMQKSLGIK